MLGVQRAAPCPKSPCRLEAVREAGASCPQLCFLPQANDTDSGNQECNSPAPGPNPDLELPPQACHFSGPRLTPGGSASGSASLPWAPGTGTTVSVITRVRAAALGVSGAFSCAKHFADRPPRIKMNYEMGATLQREKVRLGCGQMPRLGFPHACLLNNHEPFCPEAPGLPHAHSRTFMDGWPVLELPFKPARSGSSPQGCPSTVRQRWPLRQAFLSQSGRPEWDHPPF